MRRERLRGSVLHRGTDLWRSGQVSAVGVGLVLVQLGLFGAVGTPATQLRVLRQLGDAWADPVASVLALLALLAETLVAYLLVVLLLRSLSVLPGTLGRLASRVALLVTPGLVRRALDLLVGGTLLAQTTLAVVPVTRPGNQSQLSHTAMAASSIFAGSVSPAALTHGLPIVLGTSRIVVPLAEMEPVDTRPTPRRSSAPLPPWLGGGPSMATPGRDPSTTDRPGRSAPLPTPAPGGGAPSAREHVVEPHDTLWDIAAAQLGPAGRSATDVDRYWRQVYRANRPVLGPDPDRIHPGTRLDVPPYRRDRR